MSTVGYIELHTFRDCYEQYLAMSGEVHADAVVESYKERFKIAVRLIIAGLAE